MIIQLLAGIALLLIGFGFGFWTVMQMSKHDKFWIGAVRGMTNDQLFVTRKQIEIEIYERTTRGSMSTDNIIGR